MAMAMESGENCRFSDICDEPVDCLLSLIKGYEDKPLVSLTESVKPISRFFSKIEEYVHVALHNSQNPSDGLTQDESGAIYLYTMQFHDEPSLYILLNKSLRAENREQLKPWFSFLKLFVTALHKLPSQNKTVWRGVRNVNLSSKYKTGTTFVWWGVSSCTTHIEVLESKQFLGKHGQRTLFSIECSDGKCIAGHSYFKDKEKEIILMPGSYFEVIGHLNPAHHLHIIQLKEISRPIILVKSPFSKCPTMHFSPVVNTSHMISQFLSKVVSKSRTSKVLLYEMPLKTNTKWKQIGITVAGGNDRGSELNQLSNLYGIFIDDNQTIYISDSDNHRIIQWEFNANRGQILAGGNGIGNKTNQLNHPRDIIIDKENDAFLIADWGNRRIMQWFRHNNTNGQMIIEDIDCFSLKMDQNGYIYISDWKKNEVKRWKRGEKDGTILAGGNGKGNDLNQLDRPTFIFVDDYYSLYVSDQNNNRVMKWEKDAKEGICVAGGNGQGNSLTQLSLPYGIIVDQLDQIYLADWGNHRVMRWCKGATEGTIVVSGNGEEERSNQLNDPVGLSFDLHGNLYVVECSNHRIQKFEIDLN